MTDPSRTCDRVRSHMPLFVKDDSGRFRRRLIERHLRRCDDCAAERDRQVTVWTQLQQLGQTAADAVPDTAPPDDLLARLLDDASDPGLRGRAAVPVRGAISGARPGLTVALIATMFAIAAAAVWTGWHLGSRWRAEE